MQKYSIHYEGDEEPSEYYTKDGKAAVSYANGDSYNGDLVDKKKHGKGKYTWAQHNKASYDGDWVENIRTGMGKFIYPDGAIYEGTKGGLL